MSEESSHIFDDSSELPPDIPDEFDTGAWGTELVISKYNNMYTKCWVSDGKVIGIFPAEKYKNEFNGIINPDTRCITNPNMALRFGGMQLCATIKQIVIPGTEGRGHDCIQIQLDRDTASILPGENLHWVSLEDIAFISEQDGGKIDYYA